MLAKVADDIIGKWLAFVQFYKGTLNQDDVERREKPLRALQDLQLTALNIDLQQAWPAN